jgi:hypothetical protein
MRQRLFPREGGMAHVREGLTFNATAGCVGLVSGAAVALLIYAALTFAGLVPPLPAQSLVSLTF